MTSSLTDSMPTRVTEAGLYVQYGCGDCAPEGWESFDASPRLRFERLPIIGVLARAVLPPVFPARVRRGDILRGLPVVDGAATGVYCSHVLEHLPREALAVALAETRRMLKPGGRFRLVVPDLDWRARRYLEAASAGDPMAADRFLYSCMLGTVERASGLNALLRRSYGLSAHLWMYDFAALKLQLEEAEFISVRRCEFGDSGDPMFARVEDKARFVDAGERELAIEAMKPV